jgi:hypothetical protein
MHWYTYSIPPIDTTWDHLRTVNETLKDMADREASSQFGAAQEYQDVQAFLKSWTSAKDAAQDAGWEGDFRGEPVVFWLPMEEFEYGFAFKQDNNGTTFVISPAPLPWLSKWAEST